MSFPRCSRQAHLGSPPAVSICVWQQAAAPQDGAHVAFMLRCVPLHLLPHPHLQVADPML